MLGVSNETSFALLSRISGLSPRLVILEPTLKTHTRHSGSPVKSTSPVLTHQRDLKTILIVMRSNTKLPLCQANAHEFPIISRIAHDYPTIPNAIVSVK